MVTLYVSYYCSAAACKHIFTARFSKTGVLSDKETNETTGTTSSRAQKRVVMEKETPSVTKII